MSVIRLNRIILTGAMLSLAALASGCSSIDRLSQIGEKPKLTEIENPTTQPGYKPVQMPMPKPEQASYNANSLWRNGSRAFFKDQRAARIGDILTVTVNITDKANIANETQRSRTEQGRLRASPISSDPRRSRSRTRSCPARILTTDSTSSSDGKGSVNRQEALQTNVAAVVTQVLPNGNLVVEGKQEIRVNFEIRELIVAGIVRPEDIQSDNTIDSSQDRAGPHRLWRPRPDHRRAATPLRPAGDGRAAAVLVLFRAPTSRCEPRRDEDVQRGLRQLPWRGPWSFARGSSS